MMFSYFYIWQHENRAREHACGLPSLAFLFRKFYAYDLIIKKCLKKKKVSFWQVQ